VLRRTAVGDVYNDNWSMGIKEPTPACVSARNMRVCACSYWCVSLCLFVCGEKVTQEQLRNALSVQKRSGLEGKQLLDHGLSVDRIENGYVGGRRLYLFFSITRV